VREFEEKEEKSVFRKKSESVLNEESHEDEREESHHEKRQSNFSILEASYKTGKKVFHISLI